MVFFDITTVGGWDISDAADKKSETIQLCFEHNGSWLKNRGREGAKSFKAN
jgi:hypothetical protein